MEEREQEDSLGHSEVGPGLGPSLELIGHYSGGRGYDWSDRNRSREKHTAADRP